MTTRLLLAGLMTGLLGPSLFAQGTKDDYERSARVDQRLRGTVESFRPSIQWLPDAAGVWWTERRDGAELFVRVDAASGERRESDSAEALDLPSGPRLLPPRSQWGRSSRSVDRTSITFRNDLDRNVRLFWSDRSRQTQQYGELAPGQQRELSTFVGHVWLADFAPDDLAGIWVAEAAEGLAVVDRNSRDRAMSRAGGGRERARPRAMMRLEVDDHDVVGTDAEGNQVRLTEDGRAEDRYLGRFTVSPDGRRALGFQETVVSERRVPMVESSPRDQLQPELHWMNYRKPGDELPQRRPRLFDLEQGRQIEVDEAPFLDSWRIDRVRWSADSSEVFCLYNRRGHQQLALRAIDAATGAVRDVVSEQSETFVDYSQKTWLHWLDADQLLWASERDGHNHLYRIDARSGEVLNQVTQGPWVMRRVEHVDEELEEIWFVAMGIHPDQDPYHEHLARVNFDGSGLVVLTEGDGTHRFDFDEERRLFLDRWSRVDQPTVTELRDARDGRRIAELGRDDASGLAEAGFAPPQRFVAPGRDGETPIWGIIVRPSNFDPSRRYPVLEEVYAGPHDHHVPKSWGSHTRLRRMAELGFILVRIDGMGTNWRSKTFHDVCWRNLDDGGFPDRIAWMRAAAAQHPEMDLERVGIYGGSAGGQNALAAVLHHGDFYDAAAADCGCHDNRMDKIWWNEAWMGVVGPHYEEVSNVTHAGKLNGDLLLTVGELDRNVDPASTLQVVDALIRADKDFDFVIVPGAGHGIGESRYLFRRRQDFFVRSLHGVEPRR